MLMYLSHAPVITTGVILILRMIHHVGYVVYQMYHMLQIANPDHDATKFRLICTTLQNDLFMLVI